MMDESWIRQRIAAAERVVAKWPQWKRDAAELDRRLRASGKIRLVLPVVRTVQDDLSATRVKAGG